MRTILQRYYSEILDTMRPVARECGYALAVHGSMKRDLDLIALAWRPDPESPSLMADKLARSIGVTFAHLVNFADPHRFIYHIITPKYRRLEDGEKIAEGFIDLSVARTGLYYADSPSGKGEK